MTVAEMEFRSACASRILRDRVRHRMRQPVWNRSALASSLSQDVPGLQNLARLIREGAWELAEETLARHFSARPSAWPVSARDRDTVTAAIASRFPAARSDAVDRADRIVSGTYDLLGYRNVHYGIVPDWHRDAVHGRRAPRRFWADVSYLDPSFGDHKITWELNRHQHWLALGRAFWLDGNAGYAQAFIDQLYSWLEANPPLTGVNWASMLELAFRSISWTWALEFFGTLDDAHTPRRPWRTDLLVALDRQLAHIAQNLSRYFSPNTHLTGEALALYVVSLALPELRASAARAALGRDVLLQEARRQVLPDGGHAERSTHYHRYSTDFYLFAAIVARKAHDPVAVDLAAAARAQAVVLRTLADDHGGLQTIGDDDGGQLFAICGTPPADVRTTLAIAAETLADPALAVSPMTEEACWVAGSAAEGRAGVRSIVAPRERWGSRLLPDTGYFVSRAQDELAILDAGAHGYLNGGHAHADALAVVTTRDASPLLIDPGTGTYTMDPALRDRLRSGRMHNTVLLDGDEHTRVNGPFQWSRSTDARFLLTHVGERCDVAQGTHDGYANVRHVRTLFAVHGAGWLVVDQILGRGRHRADTFWHIGPSWMPIPSQAGVMLQHRATGLLSSLTATADAVTIVDTGPDAIHAPEYGHLTSAPVIETAHEAEAPFAIATFVAASDAAAVDVAVAIHSCAAPEGWVGVAVLLTGSAIEAAALTAAPTGRGASWPGTRYGVPGLQTNGRAAISVRLPDRIVWQEIAGGSELTCQHDVLSRDSQLAYAVHRRAR
ncbi:MAG TPA: alginate lyase family protein [Vicinamibacterales bacterium]|nr:alginate lyase family protein [Vicinamibacterales bacterium]